MRRERTRGPLPPGAAALLTGIGALAMLPALASGHGSVSADADRPSFDGQARRLSGVGRYTAQYAHQAIKVRVCLRKRFGRRFFKVKCKTRQDDDRSVRAAVSVPGCPKGVWRTTAFGEVRLKSGAWVHGDFARSRKKRC